jgi:hypothetical protein
LQAVQAVKRSGEHRAKSEEQNHIQKPVALRVILSALCSKLLLYLSVSSFFCAIFASLELG